jgi:hypothetical protein
MARELTARFARSSPIGSQRAPAVQVFQTPPDTPPTYMTFGSAGSITRVRVRPPTLPGPRNVQRPKGFSDGSSASEAVACSVIARIAVRASS